MGYCQISVLTVNITVRNMLGRCGGGAYVFSAATGYQHVVRYLRRMDMVKPMTNLPPLCSAIDHNICGVGF